MTEVKTILIQKAIEQLQSGEGDYTRLEQFLIRMVTAALEIWTRCLLGKKENKEETGYFIISIKN